MVHDIVWCSKKNEVHSITRRLQIIQNDLRCKLDRLLRMNLFSAFWTFLFTSKRKRLHTEKVIHYSTSHLPQIESY